MNLLWDIIAAKGFEKDMYFEMAARDIRALPKLEGTVHVNMALVIKFMKNYFFQPGDKRGHSRDPRGQRAAPRRVPLRPGADQGAGEDPLPRLPAGLRPRRSCANVNVSSRKQIRTFKQLLDGGATRQGTDPKDIDFLLILGELFTLVVYGQLIIENAPVHSVSDDVLDQIFDFLVRDFSKFALQLYSKTSSTSMQRVFCRRMIRKPVVDHTRFERIWEEHVYALRGAYRMNQ